MGTWECLKVLSISKVKSAFLNSQNSFIFMCEWDEYELCVISTHFVFLYNIFIVCDTDLSCKTKTDEKYVLDK